MIAKLEKKNNILRHKLLESEKKNNALEVKYKECLIFQGAYVVLM